MKGGKIAKGINQNTCFMIVQFSRCLKDKCKRTLDLKPYSYHCGQSVSVNQKKKRVLLKGKPGYLKF